MSLNTNQTLFVVIFSLIATVILLTGYVCWLRRLKMKAKKDMLSGQHRLEREQQQNMYDNLTASQLQELKPVLLQKLYNHNTTQPYHDETLPRYTNPFEDTPQYTPTTAPPIATTNTTTRQYQNQHRDVINIFDESETDATIIHIGQENTAVGNPVLRQ
ncbi:hypothetical protein BDF20DRAFT_895284 [Mycotypha africana]|uniref:uncharacterized protein n=1 Tax=Mycotypha africana TaxID=64632 RepID=UPI002300D8F0|nr:uncharacterized protein BDF20DRAFT_895284 [Mycotypha africana]KAI8968259.1 hypothetical protein BDF20DRAFT_895284 [Mycotypha africana]